MKDQYKLTKISDDKFDGKHPNGIYEGDARTGFKGKGPVVGDRYEFRGIVPQSSLLTSVVVSVEADGIFKTMYSTYKLEKIKNT